MRLLKYNNAIIKDLEPSITDLNALLLEYNYHFTARVIANEDFNEIVLKPILIASDGVSDTSELFMRGYQLIKMFGDEGKPTKLHVPKVAVTKAVPDDTLSELKIGKIAQTFLPEALEGGKVDEEEINQMRTKEYSKRVFGIDFPLLVLASEEYDSKRYYAKPLVIKGEQYRLCSQWYEKSANNDRPFLLSWLEKHGAIV